MLRATTPCTFSTSQLPKVVRSWGVLCFFASKCASRRNGVQLFISHLARWLRTRRFSEPTFGPSGATNHWKNSVSRLCYLFAHLRLLSSDLFSSDSSPCWLLFHLSILSEVWLLNFPSKHSITMDSIFLFLSMFTFLFREALGSSESLGAGATASGRGIATAAGRWLGVLRKNIGFLYWNPWWLGVPPFQETKWDVMDNRRWFEEQRLIRFR